MILDKPMVPKLSECNVQFLSSTKKDLAERTKSRATSKTKAMKQLSYKEWLNKIGFLLEKGQLKPYVAQIFKTVSCKGKR